MGRRKRSEKTVAEDDPTEEETHVEETSQTAICCSGPSADPGREATCSSHTLRQLLTLLILLNHSVMIDSMPSKEKETNWFKHVICFRRTVLILSQAVGRERRRRDDAEKISKILQLSFGHCLTI